MSSKIDVNVSVYSLELEDCPWDLISPNAMELRLLMCSMVYCAYWVKFCLMAIPFVEGVTLGTSYLIMESTYVKCTLILGVQ